MGRSAKGKPSIVSSSLEVAPRPGIPSQGLEAARQWVQTVRAKSLDRDHGDVHIWPHSHYLMRQCNGVGGLGESAAKVRCAGAGAGAKSMI